MHRFRATSIALSASAAALGLVALSGCSAVEKALDCAHTATTVAASVDELGQVLSEGVENPVEAQEALNRIDENVREIGEKTDNADVDKAAEDMHKAVTEAEAAVKEGRTPDLSPITAAGGELTKVCAPG